MLEVQAFVGNDLWPWFCSNVTRSSDCLCVSSAAFILPCFCIADTVPRLAFGHPRAPKLLPRSSQGAPKSSQGAPKSSQDRPSYALVIRNSAPRFARRTQGGLKEHQRVPDELPRAPNELPRTSQQHPRAPTKECPRTPTEHSRAPKHSQRTPKELPRSTQELPRSTQELPRSTQELPKSTHESGRSRWAPRGPKKYPKAPRDLKQDSTNKKTTPNTATPSSKKLRREQSCPFIKVRPVKIRGGGLSVLAVLDI